jgi:small-conductance mechanosensitive channel
MNFSNLEISDFYTPVLLTVGSFLILWALKKFVVARLSRISQSTDNYIDDIVTNVLCSTRQFWILGVSLYIGVHSLDLKPSTFMKIDRVFIILGAIQGIIWGKAAISSWVEITIQRKNSDPSVRTSLGFVGIVLKMLLIAAVVIFALNNLGVNVSTFIAGLGVGGIAIALATQNILGDLFSSLSIVLDKPFVVGDYISLGEWQGTIEKVGLKTTRIRSLSGEQIIVSNSDLLSSKIRNYKRMEERRVAFTLGLEYSTKREDLKKAPGIVEQIIRSYPKTKFDRAHFLNYGPSSLDVEVVYIFQSAVFNEYADVHQKILIDINEAFEANNLEFAFPTQSIIVERKIKKLV